MPDRGRDHIRGTLVRFRDENKQVCRGHIIGYGQANDGTGRYGYDIRTLDGRIYWRPSREIRRG